MCIKIWKLVLTLDFQAADPILIPDCVDFRIISDNFPMFLHTYQEISIPVIRFVVTIFSCLKINTIYPIYMTAYLAEWSASLIRVRGFLVVERVRLVPWGVATLMRIVNLIKNVEINRQWDIMVISLFRRIAMYQ